MAKKIVAAVKKTAKKVVKKVTKKKVVEVIPVVCSDCGGKGLFDQNTLCGNCNGSGKI